MRLQGDFVLFARITVLGLKLADLLEGEDGLLHLPQCDIRLSLPVEPLHVRRVKLDCLAGIKEGQLTFFHL